MSYINLFYIFIVLAIVMLVLSIVLFFIMDIPNAIRIVNKKPPKKKGHKTQNKSLTGDLSQKHPTMEDKVIVSQIKGKKKKTTVLPTNRSKEKKKTTVLSKNQVEMSTQPRPIHKPQKKTTVLQSTTNSQINKKTGDMNASNTNNDIFEIIETTAFIASEKTI